MAGTRAVEVRLRRINAWYGRTQALFDVDLTCSPGSTIALVGTNGAGKTTLVRSILGLVRCTGSIAFDGHEASNVPTFRRVREFGIAVVHEGRGLYYDMSVAENLVVGWRRVPESQIDGAMSLFPTIRRRLATQVGALSGGEQQMVALGRVFLARPRLVLLDEPGLGLSPRLVSEVYRTLEELKNRGVSIILVEQSIERALDFADELVVLSAGRNVRVLKSGSGVSGPDVERLVLGEEP